ncbi:MAG: DNA polymerase I [Pseudomonadota bacterium]
MSTPLVLVDGSSYLFRAFHALPPLTSSKGDPTGAIHGVLNMLNKLVREEGPERIAVVFDASGKTFRDRIYPEYKATRPPMPDDLRAQIQPLHDIIRAMGLPLLIIPDVEADDVIGTLAMAASKRGLKCLVSTSDKDLAQLVTDQVTLVNTMSDTLLDRDGVHAKFGVWPEQIADWLALVGDSVDNIPGVPGVGGKTAAALLEHFDSIDALYADTDQVADVKVRGAKKLGPKLAEHREAVDLSKRLTVIDCDVDLPVDLDDLAPAQPDNPTLRALYQQFELRTLLKALDSAEPMSDSSAVAAAPANDGNAIEVETVLSKKAFAAWKKRIRAAKLTALDTETNSLDYMVAELVGLSLAVDSGAACYVPVAHNYPGAPEQLDRDWVLGELKAWLESAKHPKVGHHLKYDAHIFANYGIKLGGIAFDSMLESYVLNSTATRHDMDSVAKFYLGRDTIHYEDVAGKGAKQLTFDQVPLETAAPYAAEDAAVTLALHEHLDAELAKTKPLADVYRDIEQPLVPVLIAMEQHGVALDGARLKRQSTKLAKSMDTLEQKAHELAGGPFNLGSPKQLQEILFGELGLPVLRKTPKGQPSTAEDVLAELAVDYELPEVILEYRSVAKLKSTYTDKLPLDVGPDGRIHTSYHQAVAATGRLSSSDPNLQNIPIRTPEGRRIRQAFVAAKGYTLLAADYSQIELRIMAHLSGDEGLTDAFANDMDVHRATAAEVFGLAPDEVSSDERRSAKAINFGLIYGMSAFGLAKQLGIARGEAQQYIDTYFERYPGVREYMDRIRHEAHELGYVSTVFGRRLYLPDINAKQSQRRQYAERTAINAPMQGTAADIIKRAMIRVHDWLERDAVDARLIMQVHDELVFEVRDDQVDEVAAQAVEFMMGAAELDVPLKVDYGAGDNWDEAH